MHARSNPQALFHNAYTANAVINSDTNRMARSVNRVVFRPNTMVIRLTLTWDCFVAPYATEQVATTIRVRLEMSLIPKIGLFSTYRQNTPITVKTARKTTPTAPTPKKTLARWSISRSANVGTWAGFTALAYSPRIILISSPTVDVPTVSLRNSTIRTSTNASILARSPSAHSTTSTPLSSATCNPALATLS